MEGMEERMFSVEAKIGDMAISIEELQRQRIADRSVLTEMRNDLKDVKEIVTAWNNFRGFANTWKAINSFVWFIAKAGAVIAAVIFAIYMFGKTGHWIWPVNKP